MCSKHSTFYFIAEFNFVLMFYGRQDIYFGLWYFMQQKVQTRIHKLMSCNLKKRTMIIRTTLNEFYMDR